MKALLFALLTLLVPSAALAQYGGVGGRHQTFNLGTLLDAAPMNGAASTLTFYIGPASRSTDPQSTTAAPAGFEANGYDTYLLLFDFDYDSNAGAISTTCTGGPTRATATYNLTTCTMATGTCTINMSGVFTTASLSADTKWGIPISTTPFPVVKCVVSHGGSPGANELITVTGYAVAQ